MKLISRRDTLKILTTGVAAMSLPSTIPSKADSIQAKKHFITLSFDDGFKKSSIKTAEIFEKYKLAACINVIATAHLPDFDEPNEYHHHPVGDFGVWNELKQRGHEIMMHGYRHANKTQLSFEEGKILTLRCIDVFSKELKGFDVSKSIYNLPYNASTPELEAWLPSQVMAFRTGGPAINAVPHRNQVKLTCTSHGPDNIDKHLSGEIDNLLALPSGWLIYNTHGLDDEGWGPMTSSFLDRLLAKLVAIETVEVVPCGVALSRFK